MTNRLKGKIAVTTAAGQGIGRAIAEAFIAEGATVIASDLDDSKLKGLGAKQSVKLDVRSTAAIEALAQSVAKEFGAPHILVNCAGFVHDGSVLQCSEADWEFSFDLNVKAMHRMIHAFLPAMLKEGRGSIVNMSSAVSSIRGVPNRYVYGATKAYVLAFSHSLQHELADKGIRVQAVLPGATATDMWEIAGLPWQQLPPSIVMSVEDMVDAALAGLDQGELVTIPGLHDGDEWTRFEAARRAISQRFGNSVPASRYKIQGRRSA